MVHPERGRKGLQETRRKSSLSETYTSILHTTSTNETKRIRKLTKTTEKKIRRASKRVRATESDFYDSRLRNVG